jgi:biotin carboxylase
VPRVLLLVPSFTYRAADFVQAAARLDTEVVIGSDRRQALAERMGDRALVVDCEDVDAGVAAIAELHARRPLDAVVAVDDQGVVVAAAAGASLGLRHNPPDAVRRTRDKAAMRVALAAAGVAQPDFVVVGPGQAPVAPGFPCVVKPTGLSASRGVIRADDDASLQIAAARVRAIAGDDGAPLVVERFVAGDEVALEGLLRSGRLEVLAVFDKPDPLDGPYFEETIYVTPSRRPTHAVAALAQQACDAIGLREGAVHAEARIDDAGRPWLLEVAGRSIGGLCARSLRFGAGISLEEVILRHALDMPLADLTRETTASGVMMLPIRTGGTLVRVGGVDAARELPGVAGVEITIPVGRPVVPLPEGDRYLGFVFARGDTPAAVEACLRQAEELIEVVVS